MPNAEKHFDWHALMAESAPRAGAAGTRERLGMLLALVAAAASLVFARAVQLELTGGAEFRALAARPLTRARELAADRGRILARDGSVLAADAHVRALAVHYRWLEQPPDAAWLRREATGELDRKQRRNAALVRSREAELLARRDDLHRRLAQLCGLADDEWQRRCERVQSHVAGLARRVNERRQARYLNDVAEPDVEADPADSWPETVAGALAELFTENAAVPPPRIVLREELDYHPLVEDLPAGAAAEIAAHANDYPGVRVVELARRQYPAGALAAHVVGHLGRAASAPAQPADVVGLVGRLGIERQYETALRGSAGVEIERIDRRGKSLAVERSRLPVAGHDVRLSLDMSLERAAQGLLDAACRRGAGGAEPASGGAAVLLDVASGEVLLAASAPGFAPQWFAAGDAESLSALLASPRHPLINRATQMAIPPGSVFKTLAAVAMVEMEVCDPEQPFHCQGYLHEPDRQRCLIFRRQGIGHGDLTLADALAQSCNVYFFHHADLVGPEPLVSWAKRFGFGRPTGIDLPDEAAGRLPAAMPDAARAQRLAAAEALAIGQGTLTVTPLQVARLMAAVANGGQLVRPRLVLEVGPPGGAGQRPPTDPATAADSQPIRVSPATLSAVREGLRRTVADPGGTAHFAARPAGVTFAGKTGTAQTSGADHAWFAGYAPAEEPRVAIVVVLEHGGAAGNAARIARELLSCAERLGYFAPPRPELAGE